MEKFPPMDKYSGHVLQKTHRRKTLVIQASRDTVFRSESKQQHQGHPFGQNIHGNLLATSCKHKIIKTVTQQALLFYIEILIFSNALQHFKYLYRISSLSFFLHTKTSGNMFTSSCVVLFVISSAQHARASGWQTTVAILAKNMLLTSPFRVKLDYRV